MTATVNEIKEEERHAHEWVVFSSALAARCLMAQCIECGLQGTVDDPTSDEWSEAFHAPARPCRWHDGSRVRVRWVGPLQVMRATATPKCECYARFGLLAPRDYEHVPAEIGCPPAPLTDDEREEFERLAEVVSKCGLCSSLFPPFIESYRQHTGHEPSSVLREVARRIEKIDGITLHCSPSVVARVLKEWAKPCRREADTNTENASADVGADAIEEPFAADAFVIYDPHELAANLQLEPQDEPEEPSAHGSSDTFLSFSARKIYRTFLIEPVYDGGKPTGEYRVWRRPCDNRNIEMEIPWEAILPTEEEAVAWGKQHTQGW